MGEKRLRQPCKNMVSQRPSEKRQSANEGGYALLALILALTILSIVLTSSVAPNYQVAAQREKEAELYWRGQQMAEGIARYYSGGGPRINPLQLRFPPAYGYLKDLQKLKEGVTINLQERKFVRASATRDPFDGEDWEPVYARDPRIMPFLQAWASQTGGIIDPELMLIAGTPIRTQTVTPPPSTPPPSSDRSSATGTARNPGDPTPPPPVTGSQTGATAGLSPTRPNNPNDDDDDDDDDDDGPGNDPLGHLFSSGANSNLPIVGVAPRKKGQAIRPFYGLRNYEEWVFIYIPPSNRVNVPQPNTPNNPQNRVSQ